MEIFQEMNHRHITVISHLEPLTIVKYYNHCVITKNKQHRRSVQFYSFSSLIFYSFPTSFSLKNVHWNIFDAPSTLTLHVLHPVAVFPLHTVRMDLNLNILCYFSSRACGQTGCSIKSDAICYSS